MSNLNLNKVILGGRLTSDPELRYTPNGIATLSVSIAINTAGKNAEAQYFDLVCWRQNAEFVAKYFKKGSNICVVGALKNRSWTDANGQKRYKTEVEVGEVMFVDSKAEINEVETVEEAVEEVAETKPKRTRKTKTESVAEDTTDDTLPF
jgi:single-strand DNA-binding protein